MFHEVSLTNTFLRVKFIIIIKSIKYTECKIKKRIKVKVNFLIINNQKSNRIW